MANESHFYVKFFTLYGPALWATKRSTLRLPKVSELFNLLRKEVIHRQLPLPMPCYDFTPVTGLTLTPSCEGASGTTRFHGVTGGVYKIRERIHRGEADPRLLAIPTS